MKYGKVKWFNKEKGYGFITESTTKKDYFVHITDLGGKPLEEGLLVTFEEEETKKGIKATEIRVGT